VTAETQPGASGQTPLDAAFEQDAFADRPEVFVGAAFIGGFVLAQILKRFRRDD
jgi:hypothetical protein